MNYIIVSVMLDSSEINIQENCWEFMKCPKTMKENCKVYKNNLGNKCWLVEKNIFKDGPSTPDACINCPWYRKNLQIVEKHLEIIIKR